MVKYAQNELFSITEISKQIGSAVTSIKEHTLEKIGILKNNKLEAVIISTEEYERLHKAYELIEDMEIASIVQERRKTPKEDYLDGNEVLKKYGLCLDN